ncbi:MAG: RHS repeat-associated core domain-containing protein [Gemmatimonadaceae bacterium]
MRWHGVWLMFRQPVRYRDSWHGTLLDDKADKVQTLYRRNRVYDPQSGRFTQEDPIGLAGGINLYGFAGGDPVNYSDPFGLCPAIITGKPCPGALATAVGFIPIVGDAIEIAGAGVGEDLLTGEDISGVGVAATFVGTVFGSGRLARQGVDLVEEGVERAGKAFTSAGKREVIEANRAANGGVTRCANCGVETVPAQRHTRGATPPANETHVDHIRARSKGGAGVPSNGQVLCRECNLEKRDHEEE